jgi:hypothetical protein
MGLIIRLTCSACWASATPLANKLRKHHKQQHAASFGNFIGKLQGCFYFANRLHGSLFANIISNNMRPL